MHPVDFSPQNISSAKIYRSTEDYPIRASLYPTILEIESTSRCNINPPCPMCMRVIRDPNKEFDIPEHIVTWLTNPIHAAQWISISGIGEPMMSTQFERMVQIAGDRTGIAFFSNAQVINQQNIDTILDKPVAHIDFSLDASTPETYLKIRGHSLKTFDIVLNNIRKIVYERNRRALQKPTMHLIMVVMKENYRELPDFVRLANKLSVEGVRYWQMRKPSHSAEYRNHKRYDFFFSFDEQCNLPADLPDTIAEAAEIAEVYGLTFLEN